MLITKKKLVFRNMLVLILILSSKGSGCIPALGSSCFNILLVLIIFNAPLADVLIVVSCYAIWELLSAHFS